MKKFLAILMVAAVCATVAFSVRAENNAEEVPETTTSSIEGAVSHFRTMRRLKRSQAKSLMRLRQALQKKMLLTSLLLLRSTSTIKESDPMKLRTRAHFVISLTHSSFHNIY